MARKCHFRSSGGMGMGRVGDVGVVGKFDIIFFEVEPNIS